MSQPWNRHRPFPFADLPVPIYFQSESLPQPQKSSESKKTKSTRSPSLELDAESEHRAKFTRLANSDYKNPISHPSLSPTSDSSSLIDASPRLSFSHLNEREKSLLLFRLLQQVPLSTVQAIHCMSSQLLRFNPAMLPRELWQLCIMFLLQDVNVAFPHYRLLGSEVPSPPSGLNGGLRTTHSMHLSRSVSSLSRAMVSSSTSGKRCLVSLSGMRLVCKSWRDYVDGDTWLWKHMLRLYGWSHRYQMDLWDAQSEGWLTTLPDVQVLLDGGLSSAARQKPFSYTYPFPKMGDRVQNYLDDYREKSALPGHPPLNLEIHMFKQYYPLFKRWFRSPEEQCFQCHENNVVTCLHLLPDGRILTASDDSLMLIFEKHEVTGEWELAQRIFGHDGGVWCCELLSLDPSARVFPTGNTTSSASAFLHQPDPAVPILAVTGSTDRTARLWNLGTGECLLKMEGHVSTIRCLSVCMEEIQPDAIQMAFASKANDSMNSVKEEDDDEDKADQDEFNRSVHHYRIKLMTGSRDHSVRVHHIYLMYEPSSNPGESNCKLAAQLLETTIMNGHSQSVRSICSTEDDVISGSYDHTVRCWIADRSDKQPSVLPMSINEFKTTTALEPIVRDGQCRWIGRGHTNKVYCVGVCEERGVVVSGSMDNTVRVWSLSTGDPLQVLNGHESLVGLLQWSSFNDEPYLITAAADNSLRTWFFESPASRRKSAVPGHRVDITEEEDTKLVQRDFLNDHLAAITCFQASPQFMISGAEGYCRLWDMTRRKPLHRLSLDISGAWKVCFNDSRAVCAIQRQGRTYVEVFDF